MTNLNEPLNPLNSSDDVAVAYGAKPENPAYKVLPLTQEYMKSVDSIEYKAAHDSLAKKIKVTLSAMTPVIGWLYMDSRSVLVPEGSLGVTTNNGKPEFLPPGWHYLADPRRKLKGVSKLNSTDPIINGPRGLVTILDGYVGVLEDQGSYKLLGPGMHQWNSPTIKYVNTIDIRNDDIVNLGPFSMLVVPPGQQAVTYNKGKLEILAENSAGDRIHFLNHPLWKFVSFVSAQKQFDDMSSTDILTQDRVEMDVKTKVAWQIVDLNKAITKAGKSMKDIRSLVHKEAKTAVASMIMNTRISNQISSDATEHVSSSSSTSKAPKPSAPEKGKDLQSVPDKELGICNGELADLGVKIISISVTELSFKQDDTRQALAKLAAIPVRAREQQVVARVEADNLLVRAKAQADAIKIKADAEAYAIKAKANALQTAGKALGVPSGTAAKLAMIDATSAALSKTDSVTFFGKQFDPTQLLLPATSAGVSDSLKS